MKITDLLELCLTKLHTHEQLPAYQLNQLWDVLLKAKDLAEKIEELE